MDLNRVLLAGRLTVDPEIKNLPSGDPVCEFGLAINRKWKNKDTNEEEEDVCFIDVKCYGKRAPIMHQHLRKGKPVLIEGQIRQERWENKDGEPRRKHVVVVENFHFVGPRTDADGPREPREATPTPMDLEATEPVRPASSPVARRRREKALAGAAAGGGASVDGGQLPF